MDFQQNRADKKSEIEKVKPIRMQKVIENADSARKIKINNDGRLQPR